MQGIGNTHPRSTFGNGRDGHPGKILNPVGMAVGLALVPFLCPYSIRPCNMSPRFGLCSCRSDRFGRLLVTVVSTCATWDKAAK
jgi:hypothetical protein